MRQNPEQILGTAGWADTGPRGFPLQGDWFVLHTRNRQEKVLHQTLVSKGVGSFLPLMTVVKLYGKRKAKVQEPMFPGYLFLRGGLDEAYSADRSGRVVNIIKVHDQQKLDWELSNLNVAMATAAPLEPFAYLTEGRRVEVRCGPFRGMQGVVEKRGMPGRLFLQIGMLGRAMSMEVDASLLDPVD